ncbi:hypothetical protein AVEN_51835-1 [Araneus ventricosus]|uniref:Uncharacterized protein n=1 Tax=Araneus ventricosus TaxID=182803 RepID=A0A4Y2WBY0_ARAVE|nr:hypothetical protein AVEN_51835-1 [Araneus ventricosus]
MSRRIRRASVLLLFLLLCSQGFASESSDPIPRRQKRGLMKMMMHIMWDPVRLIRYWYAYDVTKEIAKSWRKILPTMMLLPFNPNIADTPGIAKYVHPTHGLGPAKYQKNVKQFAYPAVSSGETYSASQFSKDYLISDPSLKNDFPHFSPGSGIVFEGPHKQSESSNLDSGHLVFRQYMNSGQQVGSEGSRNVHVSSFPVIAKEVDGSNEQHHHIIFNPVPESMFQGDPAASIHTPDSQEVAFSGEMRPLPFPYKIDFPDSSREQVIFKSIPMPIPIDGIHDVSKEKLESDVVPSSTNSDSKLTKNKYFKYPPDYPENQPIYGRYQPDPNSHVKYEDEEKDGHAPPTQHVIHTGHQELHIVLHPIPIPVNFNASESSNGGYPFMYPGVPKASGPGQSRQRQGSSPPGYDEEFYPSNNSSAKGDKSNYSHEDGETASSSSERSDSKSRVTWVLKKESKTDRRTDTKPFDNDSDGSAPRISSVNFLDGRNQGRHPLTLNGETIDLVQLKEDLRHGTPVLIPFHKKTTFSSPQSGENPSFNPPKNYDDILREKSKEVLQTSGENVFVQSNSGEQYVVGNSTQRLIFFFKRP